MKMYEIKWRCAKKFVGKGLKARLDHRPEKGNWIEVTVYDVYCRGKMACTRDSLQEAEALMEQCQSCEESMDEWRQAALEGRI